MYVHCTCTCTCMLNKTYNVCTCTSKKPLILYNTHLVILLQKCHWWKWNWRWGGNGFNISYNYSLKWTKLARAGFEPATSGLLRRHSTNWAISSCMYVGSLPVYLVNIFVLLCTMIFNFFKRINDLMYEGNFNFYILIWIQCTEIKYF